MYVYNAHCKYGHYVLITDLKYIEIYQYNVVRKLTDLAVNFISD